MTGPTPDYSALREAAEKAWDVMTVHRSTVLALLDERDALERSLTLAFELVADRLRRAEAAEAERDALQTERDEARAAIAWANNSLYGSHGFFLSTNGGLADEHHLDREIEKLKAYQRTAEAEAAALRQALEAAADDADRIAKIIDANLWHQREKVEDARSLAIGLREEARAALTTKGTAE